MRTCCACGASFEPTGNGYRCLPCRLAYDREWRAKRKAQGNPVVSNKMPPEYHREYQETYKEREGVRARRAAKMREYSRDHVLRPRHEARWQVRRAVEAGRIARQPCEVCGEPRTQAHHDDYSRPLDVRWLCATHHREHHSKAEGR